MMKLAWFNYLSPSLVVLSIALSPRLWGPVMTSSFGTATQESDSTPKKIPKITSKFTKVIQVDGGAITVGADSEAKLQQAEKLARESKPEERQKWGSGNTYESQSGVQFVYESDQDTSKKQFRNNGHIGPRLRVP